MSDSWVFLASWVFFAAWIVMVGAVTLAAFGRDLLPGNSSADSSDLRPRADSLR